MSYKTSLKNIKGINEVMVGVKLDTKVESSVIHESQGSKDIHEYLIHMDIPDELKFKGNVKDFITTFNQMYTGSFGELSYLSSTRIDCSRVSIKSTENNLIMNQEGDSKLAFEVSVNKESDIFELAETELFQALFKNGESEEFRKIYLEQVAYIFRMYRALFNTKIKDCRGTLTLKDGRVYIKYIDFTKYNPVEGYKNITKVEGTINNFGGTYELLKAYPNIVNDLDLKYENLGKYSVLSFNTAFDKSVFEVKDLILNATYMLNLTLMIDNMFIKYGIERFEIKYLMEELLTNLMFHNFNIDTKTIIAFRYDKLVLLGNM